MGVDPRDPRSEDETLVEDTRVLPRDRYAEEEVVEPRRRGPLLWPWLLALLLLVLAGLAALWYFTREETKAVPDTVGQTLEMAVTRLQDEGFKTDISQENDDSPEGRVFEQDPAGGEEAEEGSTVAIVVSRGPATAEVPDVVDALVDDARDQLEDVGFQVNVVEVFSDQPSGQVVAQNPRGGTEANEGSTVRLNVSKGTGRVEVPDVVGRTADEAGSILREAGLEANVFRVPSDEPEGTVVAQSPAAGSEIARGESVRINVSNGEGAEQPADEEVPDVVGLPEAEAVGQLEEAGFTVRIRREETTDETEDGVVLRQEPAGAETAERGSEVAITVAELAPSD